MNTIPHIDFDDDGVSGHFCGINLTPEGFWVEFSLREGLDGSDILVLRQQVCDVDHKLRLDSVVNIARQTLVNNLEQIVRDILSGKVVEDDPELYDLEDDEDSHDE